MDMSARRKSRLLACQAIYQWQMTNDDVQLIYKQFIEQNYGKNYDEDYFSGVFFGVCKNAEQLDSLFLPHATEKQFVDLTPIELALLRIGTFELKNRPDIPAEVVIAEAIRLSRKFGATDGYKFINAVLDKMTKAS